MNALEATFVPLQIIPITCAYCRWKELRPGTDQIFHRKLYGQIQPICYKCFVMLEFKRDLYFNEFMIYKHGKRN